MLHTPLAATFGVLIGLLLLIIPLHHLTSGPPTTHQATQGVEIDDCVDAWASLRLLAPAQSVILRQSDGKAIWSAGPLPAGEHTTRVTLPPLPGKTEFILEITFVDAAGETAAFLALAPDGHEEVTCHAIGRGTIRELLRFEWATH